MLSLQDDFPLLKNNDFSYLDCAATTPIPSAVINAWVDYQSNIGVSIGHGNNRLSDTAEEVCFDSVCGIMRFFLCEADYNIIFTKNATEASNLLAYSLKHVLTSGDVVLSSEYEHHSNLLPWKRTAAETGAQIVMLPIQEDGTLDYGVIDLLPANSVKIAVLSLVSNVNGYVLSIKELKRRLGKETLLILDITQAAGHMQLDLTEMNASAYILSGHKMYAPKNIGACIIRADVNDMAEPFLLGGGMADSVIGSNKTWKSGVMKFNAGTFDVGLIKAWAEACRYLIGIGWNSIAKHEKEIMEQIKEIFAKQSIIRIISNGGCTSSICSFRIDGIHPHDIARMMNDNGLIIRTGHMCAQHAMNAFGIESVSRLSWGICNNEKDVKMLNRVFSRLCVG